jgi:hypothetical protein
MYPTETEVDNVSDLSVRVNAAYEDPTVQEFLDDVYRNEAALTDRDFEQMEAAARADDIEFGPFDRAGWEETMSKYPEGTGLVPVIGPRKDSMGNEVWDAELRRPRKDGTGYDVVWCLWWPTQREAWAACVSRAITMVALCEVGRRDLAERFFTR